MALAMNLMLALFEWGSGNVQACFQIVKGADAIATTFERVVASSQMGLRVMKGWAEVRAQMHRRRLPFRSLPAESDERTEVAAHHLSVRHLTGPMNLSLLLTQAYRVRNRLVWHTQLPEHGTVRCLGQYRELYNHHFGFAFEPDPQVDGRTPLSMSMLEASIQEVRDSLMHIDLPIKALEVIDDASTIVKSVEERVRSASMHLPKMRCAAQAWDYLRYAVIVVLTSSHLLQQYIPRTSGAVSKCSVPSAVIVLLSLLQHVDLRGIRNYDIYDSGALWMLETLLLSCPHVEVVEFVKHAILPRFDHGPPGDPLAMDIAQTKRNIKVIAAYIQHLRVPLQYDPYIDARNDLCYGITARTEMSAAISGRDKNGKIFIETAQLAPLDIAWAVA